MKNDQNLNGVYNSQIKTINAKSYRMGALTSNSLRVTTKENKQMTKLYTSLKKTLLS